MMATFNTRGDQPDHARGAAEAALPSTWPADRRPPPTASAVAVGAVTLRELGGAQVPSLGPLPLRDKREPVEAYLLEALRRASAAWRW